MYNIAFSSFRDGAESADVQFDPNTFMQSMQKMFGRYTLYLFCIANLIKQHMSVIK